jgi:hypothetical protein
VLARRKLRHYFEAHPVTVVSLFPLGEIIRNPNAAGRIAKWFVELMGKTLAYAPRKAIKSQIGMAMGGCGSGVAKSHPHPHSSKKFTPAPIMLKGGFSHPHPHPRVTRRVLGARWV